MLSEYDTRLFLRHRDCCSVNKCLVYLLRPSITNSKKVIYVDCRNTWRAIMRQTQWITLISISARPTQSRMDSWPGEMPANFVVTRDQS